MISRFILAVRKFLSLILLKSTNTKPSSNKYAVVYVDEESNNDLTAIFYD